MESSKQRVYGYKRVSTEEQVDGMSLQNQELAILAYADRNNFEVVEIFSDEGFSAKTANRPALQKMLKKINAKDNDVTGVVVYNLSRISRNLESYSRDIGFHISARGVTLHSTTENIDDTPQGKLMRNISFAFHQYDNDIKSTTTTDNMHLVALEGWWQGKIPYGYKALKVPIDSKTKDGKQKERLTLEPETKDNLSGKITMFLERFSKGDLTQAEIADYAESINLKSASGGRFAPQSVKNMLINYAYAGYICNKLTNNEPVNGKHDGHISLPTFHRNQAILNKRREDITSSSPRPSVLYPLKHVLLCPSCHKFMTGSAPTGGSGQPSPRYHCTHCNGMGSISPGIMERLFESFLQEITPTASTVKLFKLIVKRTAARKLKDTNTQLEGIREEISKIDQKIEKTFDLFLEDKIEKDEKEAHEQRYRLERIKLEDEVDKLEGIQRLNEGTIDYVCNFIDKPAKMWRDADPATKIEFQKIVIPGGVEFDIKTQKFGTATLSPLYRVKATIKDPSVEDESLMVTSRGIEPRLQG